jgi:hypothetical protein
MKAALPDWIDFYFANDSTPSIKSELLQMPESCSSRFLAKACRELTRNMNSRKRKGLRKYLTEIPLRQLDSSPTELGPFEIDLVAHCGNSLSGTFAWSLKGKVADLAVCIPFALYTAVLQEYDSKILLGKQTIGSRVKKIR